MSGPPNRADCRRLLPQRRRAEVIAFEHDGIRFRGHVSRYADGRLAEVFVDTLKRGDAAAAVMARDLGVAASIALQFGAPADVLRQAMTRLSSGAAAGPLGALLDALEGA